MIRHVGVVDQRLDRHLHALDHRVRVRPRRGRQAITVRPAAPNLPILALCYRAEAIILPAMNQAVAKNTRPEFAYGSEGTQYGP